MNCRFYHDFDKKEYEGKITGECSINSPKPCKGKSVDLGNGYIMKDYDYDISECYLITYDRTDSDGTPCTGDCAVPKDEVTLIEETLCSTKSKKHLNKSKK